MQPTNTIIIYGCLTSNHTTYAIVEGDYSHLHNKFVSFPDTTEAEAAEIDALMKHIEANGLGKDWHNELDVELFKAIRGGSISIITGYMP